jgi:MoxR-like ATPase
VTALPRTVADTETLLAANGYIADLELATTVHLALTMQRPLFLEGEPGTAAMLRWDGSVGRGL